VTPNVSSGEVLAFWLAAGPHCWFTHDDAFDLEIRTRYQRIHKDASAGLLSGWESTPEGALALTIVFDQFSRNIFRGSARAYATDRFARSVASRAIARGFDQQIKMPARTFFYLPFEHSESSTDQEFCLSLLAATGDAELLQWAKLHADTIRRFGRFPHRNAALGRITTPEEQAFLANGGFSG
jgi:uncharacterized protein (DUF924 family)